jgi:ribonucleotide monophosphatase NagD (HAD superfamily)
LDPVSITVAATAEKIEWVRAAAGERFDQLELSTHSSGWPVMVTNNARAEAQRRVDDLRQRTGVELTVDELLDSPHVYVGTIEQLTEKCLSLRERLGISTFMLGHPHELAGVVERLAGA